MRHLKFIFLATFFFSIHMALLAYVNSSMLAKFATPNLISITYAVSSILSLVLLTLAPSIIRVFGNIKYVSISLLISAVLLFLISTKSTAVIIPLFIVYFSLNSVILYGLDIFLEHYSTDKTTGNIRGLYLTLGNVGWIIAPFISGSLEFKYGFPIVYLLASLSVFITFIIIIFSQRGFVDRFYKRNSFICPSTIMCVHFTIMNGRNSFCY